MAQYLTETVKSGFSYWIAYDETLNPHKFRVIKYELVSETFYTTKYGWVSVRKEGGHNAAFIKPKGRDRATFIFPDDEEVTDQVILSLLIYWTVEPLFLAVPAPEIEQANQTIQDTIF